MYVRPISTRLFSGTLMPAIRAIRLPLSLLVTRVLADHQDRPVAADDLALLAHRLDRRSYLHGSFRLGDHDPALAAAAGRRYRSRIRARGFPQRTHRRLTIARGPRPPMRRRRRARARASGCADRSR